MKETIISTMPPFLVMCHIVTLSGWSGLLKCDPVEGDDSLQNISAKVKHNIFEADKGEKSICRGVSPWIDSTQAHSNSLFFIINY